MPEEELEKNKMEGKEEYISLAKATEFCPHSQDYLSLRARQGKLKSVKLGRNWATKKEWVENYVLSMNEYREDLNDKIIKKGGNLIALKREEQKQLPEREIDKSLTEKSILSSEADPLTETSAVAQKASGFKFTIVTGLAFLVLLSSFAFWQQILPSRYKQFDVFDTGVAGVFQPIAKALDHSFADINLAFTYYFFSEDKGVSTYQKGVFQETADIFGSYFSWAKEKISQPFSSSEF